MTDRFDPRDLLRGSIRSLSNRTRETSRPDVVARTLVTLVPIAVGVTAARTGFPIASPDSVLAGFALLSGGLLAAFAQIAAWRDRLTERAREYADSEATDRDSLDEAVTQVLTATLATVVGIVGVVLGEGYTEKADGSLVGFWSGLVCGVGSYVMLLFVLVVLKLYDTYLTSNKVRKGVSGAKRV